MNLKLLVFVQRLSSERTLFAVDVEYVSYKAVTQIEKGSGSGER